MTENPHIYVCPVMNPDYQGDINKIINGTLQEMKKALIQWQENIKKTLNTLTHQWILYHLYG